ncbi:hypothetical protein [Arthrobacter sp. SD76]|uniref:hypothetical protein n=1 Tax=Arthrobacter sp. SD76 TaxID=3415007 RepID=UPI003C70FE36
MTTRSRAMNIFEAAATSGNYGDVAVIPLEVDPQITLSRNSVTQPFYMVYDHDTVLAQMSGSSRLRLRESSVLYFDSVVGDHTYIPAGTPHRIEPQVEGVLVRYSTNEENERGALFVCDACGADLHRVEWTHDHDVEPVRIYAAISGQFNADDKLRTCSCGHVNAPVPVELLGWTV